MRAWRAWAWLIVALAGTSAAGGTMAVTETIHYRIHSDLDPAMVQSCGRRMDAMWAEYAHRLADFPLPDRGRKFDVYLFDRKAEYVALTGDRLTNTGGVFSSSSKLLAAYLEHQGPDGLRRVLQHEAFHQFADAAVGENIPPWINEGLAQIFQEGIWTGDHFLLGQIPPGRIVQLRGDLQAHRLVPFKTFVAMTSEQWLSDLRDPARTIRQYNQAWAMAEFLVDSTGPDGHPLYIDDLIEMLRMIRHGVGATAAFELAFSDNYAGFEKRFAEWSDSLRPTAQATYLEHLDVLADLLVALHSTGMRFDDVPALRRYLIDGDFSIAGADDPRPASFFRDVAGRLFTPDELFFASVAADDTPDLICAPADALPMRTRFIRQTDSLVYETTVTSRD